MIRSVSSSSMRIKAWFHDGEILREKFCLRNMDGCTWVILLNFPTLFAFAVSRMNFYSLAKRTFFSRNLICLHHACVQLFRAKIFAFREEKTLVESGLYSLAKRISFSRNLICPYSCACVNSFRAKFFAFRWVKAVVESSLKTVCFLIERLRISSNLAILNVIFKPCGDFLQDLC